MGSWSESCGFSGLEIREGETAYVMVLRGPTYENGHGPFDLFVPHSTLLKGTYNDYGYLSVEDDPEILTIFNEQTGLLLEQNDDFSLDMLEQIPNRNMGDNYSRFWIHGEIFDRLGELEPEFPYVFLNGKSIKVSSINEMLDLKGQDDVNYLNKLVNAIAKIKEEALVSREASIELALLLADARLTRSSDGMMAGYSTLCQERIKEGKDFDSVLAAKRRLSVLSIAAGELRKKIVPSEGVGPQHGGKEASVVFANIILETQTKRDVDQEDDSDSD
jgi:hypothetical protein